MPMPSGANDLTLGGVLADLGALGEEDCSPAMRDILEKLVSWWIGAGCPSGKQSGGTAYQAVYFGDNKFWGGKPSDPPNPDELLDIGGTTAQKVIWGIDPDGGHTLDASGTALTLTLKVTKYTFDALNFVSAVDADVSVVYNTGTECA
jgi:hypothetical protein